MSVARQTLSIGVIAVLLATLGACARQANEVKDVELADALAEADDATAQNFTGAMLQACGLLSANEVEALLGPLDGPPRRLAEEAHDTSDERCAWRATDGRSLIIGGAHEGGPERLAAIEPYTAAQIAGDWQQARLQGCCVLHAVQDQTLVTLDFSSARIELAQAALLMNAALKRVAEPLDEP